MTTDPKQEAVAGAAELRGLASIIRQSIMSHPAYSRATKMADVLEDHLCALAAREETQTELTRLRAERDAAIAERDAARAQSGVKVKALKWEQRGQDWYAETVVGQYAVGIIRGKYVAMVRGIEDGDLRDLCLEEQPFPTADQAKAAAQADHERRVLAQLEPIAGEPVTLTYRNYRGEVAQRTITPKRLWWGSTDWHPEPQWMLTAYDHDKQSDRDFALRDFGAQIEPAPAPAAPKRDALSEFIADAQRTILGTSGGAQTAVGIDFASTPDTTAVLVGSVEELARRIGAEFHVDPEKLAAFIVAQERSTIVAPSAPKRKLEWRQIEDGKEYSK